MAFQRICLAISAALMLAGCGAMPNVSLPIPERNDFKGKPLSAVIARLGGPNSMEIIDGQKVYFWRFGTAERPCRVKAVMAGDIVEYYSTYGETQICGPYEAARS